MRVCRHGCDVKMFCFSREFEKGFELKTSTSLLYLPISSSAETWIIFRNMLCQLFFARAFVLSEKNPYFETSLFAKQELCKPPTSSRVCITFSNSLVFISGYANPENVFYCLITVCCLAISFTLASENSRTEKFSQTASKSHSTSHTATDGHFNKTFTSVIYECSYCSRVCKQ